MSSPERAWALVPLGALAIIAAVSAVLGLRMAVLSGAALVGVGSTAGLISLWGPQRRLAAVALGVVVAGVGAMVAFSGPVRVGPTAVVVLRGVDLSDRDLSGADFSGADLRGADLRASCLRGVVFTNAQMDGVQLDGADTSGATGLPAALASRSTAPSKACTP